MSERNSGREDLKPFVVN